MARITDSLGGVGRGGSFFAKPVSCPGGALGDPRAAIEGGGKSEIECGRSTKLGKGRSSSFVRIGVETLGGGSSEMLGAGRRLEAVAAPGAIDRGKGSGGGLDPSGRGGAELWGGRAEAKAGFGGAELWGGRAEARAGFGGGKRELASAGLGGGSREPNSDGFGAGRREAGLGGGAPGKL